MAAASEPHLRRSTPISEQDDDSAVPYTTGTPTAATSASNDAQSTSPRLANGGSDADGDRAKRKRQPRNSACQSCAALKMKCIATAVPGVCERCSRMNRECLPAVPKPRKRRATDGFESKGMPLTDLIEHEPQAFRAVQRVFTSEHSSNSPPRRPQFQPDRPEQPYDFQRLFAKGLGMDEKSGNYFLQGVDFNLARQCCDQFRHLAACFPFVESPYVDIMAMAQTRPVTLAAICTAASSAQPELRSRLSEAFRHVLATRCIMEGEQSLDLMVGLLIYLAWQHQYYKKPQLYQKLCLLAGMATDLGIHKTPSLAEQARGGPDPELQKAFIGIYYLVSSISFMGFNKPSPLSWSSSQDRFASSLFASSGGKLQLQSYIDLAHLLEDHAALLVGAPSLNASAYVELATKSSLARLRQIRRSDMTGTMSLAFAAVGIHINARALSFPSTGPPGLSLMQLALALKEFFDDILARPPITLHHIAIIDWTNLVVSLLLSTRLASPSFVSSVSKLAGFGAGWETSSLGAMLNPDTLLDRVCNHMAAAPADLRYGPRQDGLLSWLRSICDGMKRRTVSERSDHVDSPFDTVSNLSRERRASNVGSGFGLEEGRFRAVNADAKAHLAPAVSSPWSPTAATDLGFGLFGGIGLLDESFWVAFNNR